MPKLTKRTVDAIEPQAIPAKTEPRTSPYRDDRQKWRRYGAARASLVREMLANPRKGAGNYREMGVWSQRQGSVAVLPD